jgi:aspartate racemase
MTAEQAPAGGGAAQAEKLVLIGGGVGPMAGVLLHAKLIEQTATDGTDQDHLEVIHLSRSPLIGDRTEYLQGRDVPDPVEGMLRVFRMAARGLLTEGREAVAGIPCNTFHSPVIFEPFAEAVAAEGMPIRPINMVEETISGLRKRLPGARRVGLLSTTGTRESGVYETACGAQGVELLLLPPARQDALHRAVYDRTWGLKAVTPATAEAVERVQGFAHELADAGAEAVILGCSEIPLALPEGTYGGIPYVDPLSFLARALGREAAPGKLQGGSP